MLKIEFIESFVKKLQKKIKFLIKIFAVFFSFFILYIALTFLFPESPITLGYETSKSCHISLQCLSRALIQYTEQNQKLCFPKNIDTLIQQNYLESNTISQCLKEKKYEYFPEACLDMPSHFPLLVEHTAPHYSFQECLRYGRVLYLDFEMQSFSEKHLQEARYVGKIAWNIMKNGQQKSIQEILENPVQHTFLEQSAALWRARKNPLLLPTSVYEKYLPFLFYQLEKNLETKRIVYYMNPRPTARQAIYYWHEIHPGWVVEKMQDTKLNPMESKIMELWIKELSHPNYCTRKLNWKILFPQSELPLEIMLPEIPRSLLFSMAEKMKKS